MTSFYYAFEKENDDHFSLHIVPVSDWDGKSEPPDLDDDVSNELDTIIETFSEGDRIDFLAEATYGVPSDLVQPLTDFLRSQPFTPSSSYADFVSNSDKGGVVSVQAELPTPVPEVKTTAGGLSIHVGGQVVELPIPPKNGFQPKDYKRLSAALEAYAHYLNNIQDLVDMSVPAQTKAPVAAFPKNLSLPNGFSGELVESSLGFVVYVKQNGVNIRKTKACSTEKEAVDIAQRFSRMIPGSWKDDEIEKC